MNVPDDNPKPDPQTGDETKPVSFSGALVEVAPGLSLPEGGLVWRYDRSGGPGGQNVNKVNSRATLTVSGAALEQALPGWAYRRLAEVGSRYWAADPDRLVITSDEHRSQSRNRGECLDRLREVLVQAQHRPKPRKKTKPSKRANQRRLDEKKQRGQIKARRAGKRRPE